MTREELIDHLEHLERYTHCSEDAPALREAIEMLKCSGNPNGSEERTQKRTETHACDLIKRQDAIDAVNSIDNLDAKARGGICFKLMGLPPAQPKQQWIPCKERMPNKDEAYLVSGRWASGKESIGDCDYSKEDGYFHTAWNFDVLAWMPLPEPYKERREE